MKIVDFDALKDGDNVTWEFNGDEYSGPVRFDSKGTPIVAGRTLSRLANSDDERYVHDKRYVQFYLYHERLLPEGTLSTIRNVKIVGEEGEDAFYTFGIRIDAFDSGWDSWVLFDAESASESARIRYVKDRDIVSWEVD